MRNLISLVVGTLLTILVFGLFVCWIVSVRYKAENVERTFAPTPVNDPLVRPQP